MSSARLRVGPKLSIPLDEVEIRAVTSGGPGGQHANRNRTRIEVRFDVEASSALTDSQRRRLLDRLGPVVEAASGDARSQSRNRQEALDRLAAKLADGLHVPTERRATRPTRSSKRKRVDAKKRRSQLKAQRRRPVDDG